MIELERATLVGRGRRQVVYVHPDDAERCIKVPVAGLGVRSDRRRSLERERRYLARYERTGRAMDQVSRYFGLVETSEGAGAVFELVRNQDGTVAETLGAQLRKRRVTLAECGAELEGLRRYLLRECIVVGDLHANNLARQEVAPGQFRLVLIDGVGNTDFIKVCDCFRSAARHKMRRKWKRFLGSLEQLELGSVTGQASK